MKNIRNFVIVAHVDHGKSTLADRFLELTGTVEKRKMQEQYLDIMELERERGITIKLQPVRMIYTPTVADSTRTVADSSELIYEDLTYKIRGAVFKVRKELGLGHKEVVYQRALEVEFKNLGLEFEKEKVIPVKYGENQVGVYRPDFVVADKILVELKSLPFVTKREESQLWHYLKGTFYKLALLINFGRTAAEIKRVVYDSSRPQLSASSPRGSAQVEDYILNLIDTPGHIDFSYEVSRSLAAVEGAILLVDASKGVQAQTLANFYLAKEQRLTIIPVVNKIDLLNARTAQVKEELSHLLEIESDEILEASGKTGENVEKLLWAVIEKVPQPKLTTSDVRGTSDVSKALIFDSAFDAYKGVIAYVRVFGGNFKRGDKAAAFATKTKFDVLEVGFFSPKLTLSSELSAGDIGYIATGLKDPGQIRVGDTLTLLKDQSLTTKVGNISPLTLSFKPLAGYKEPKPMVFASFSPENAEDYDLLKDALGKLKLTDASLVYEPESSAGLGRGFRLGFLGMLHVEIISERLKREFGLQLIISSPSVEYEVKSKIKNQILKIRSASQLPDPSEIESIAEPIVDLEIITPSSYLGSVMELVSSFRNTYKATNYLGKETALLRYEMPLSEVITEFYDKLKSVSSGYASMSYELKGMAVNDLIRLDILITGDIVEPFSRIVPKDKAYYEGRAMAAKLKKIVPPQWFEVAIQAVVSGKIIARESIKAKRKDVTGYLYGGDVTRKMKLLEKQKKGKKKMKETGKVNLPQEVFLKMLKR